MQKESEGGGAGYSNKIAIQYHLSGYVFICRHIFGEVARVGIVLETGLCSSSLRNMKHPTPTPVRWSLTLHCFPILYKYTEFLWKQTN